MMYEMRPPPSKKQRHHKPAPQSYKIEQLNFDGLQIPA